MRIRALITEAIANLISGTTHAGFLVLAFSLIVGGIAFLDSQQLLAIIDQAESFQTSGAAVQIINSTGEIDGRQCDAIGRYAPIEAAGALRPGNQLRAVAVPDMQINTWEVTPGLVRLLPLISPIETSGLDGVWVSDDLARSLGLRPGASLVTTVGRVRVAGVYSWVEDGRSRDLGYSLLIPTISDERFSSCWAEIWPQDLSARSLLYLSVTGDIVESSFGQLNTSLGATLNTTYLFQSRTTRYAGYLTALLGAALGFGVIWLRRLELSSSLHARVKKTDLLWQHLFEALGWVLPGSIISFAIVVLTTVVLSRTELSIIANIGARTILAGALGALLATLIGVALQKEKHLFKLFKRR